MEYLVKIGSKKAMYINLNDLEREEKEISVKNVGRGIKQWLIDKQQKGKNILIKRTVTKNKVVWTTMKIPEKAVIEVVHAPDYRDLSASIVIKQEQKREIRKFIH
ncbi:TPA: hypothetical protein U0Z15_002829 [Listeria monocytogenes]|uniref:Uncharacterized protein n=1 Tax=Listeria monocytogenes TaxID=1639 RepID=A0A823KSB9_LISMN|nr:MULTISPECIES: hypothetical protein [Listeria]EAA0320720.1 hypothetical protein [Listeria monocytogenes]EAC2545615.1 hypothetical protein [Listeria monocytogenes]EAC3663616.1 hypothetical protein [Listeria monocytogenes]EAC5067815.1 hypothetical protein [Listeria monocytogenes]EAC6269661.1 hypothetical protein [Listeria monocytogenes]